MVQALNVTQRGGIEGVIQENMMKSILEELLQYRNSADIWRDVYIARY
jgi:DNA-binding TFAR19-related protein (PDSD5 family)